jgi:branched-chain amino acid transport system substrate-binding protein
MLQDLSGPAASVGVPIRDGFQIGLDAINKAGGVNGRQLTLIALDDKSDPTADPGLVRQLLAGNASIIVASSTSSCATAAIAAAKQQGVPFLVSPAKDPSFSTPTQKGIFQPQTAYGDISAAVTFFKSRNYTRVAVLRDTTANGQYGLSALQAAIAGTGINVVSEQSHAVGVSDLTPQALQLKQSNPDIVYLYDFPGSGLTLLTALQRINWQPKILGIQSFSTAGFLSSAKGSAAGMYVEDIIDYDRSDVQSFFTKYRAQGHPALDAFAPVGYDDAQLIAKALQNAKGDPAKISEGFESISSYQGLVGVKGTAYTFTADRHRGLDKPYEIVKQIGSDGSLTKVGS